MKPLPLRPGSMPLACCALVSLLSHAGCAARDRSEVGGGGTSTPVGGEVVSREEFPGVVRLDRTCTAVKVGPRHVLTAKHCIRVLAEGSELQVQTGYVAPFARPGQDALPLPIARMKVLLKSAHATSDVGLLELAGVTPADAERFASAKIAFLSTSAELDPVDASNPSTRANALLVVGFGCEARAPIMTGNPVLASATAGKTLKKERCALAMKPDAREIVCSLFASPDGRDPARTPGLCEGDSGGPLFLRAGNSLAVVAVSSAYQADGTSRFVRVDAPSALGGWVASMTAPPVSGPSQGR